VKEVSKSVQLALLCTGETQARKHLRVGDVILSANGRQLSAMTHHEAWNYLKQIPDRTIHLVIARSSPDASLQRSSVG